jgi:hypothetical protein
MGPIGVLRFGRLINPGLGSDRALRDGFSIERIPGNKLPGYDHSVPPGQRLPIAVSPHRRFASLLCRLRQEPGPPLTLVDPILDQAGGGNVVVPVTNLMGGTQKPGQLQIVVGQLA